MKEKFEVEYVKILHDMEKLLKTFEQMEEDTKNLKKLYAQNPNDEDLIKTIKMHEESYRLLHEEFLKLNKRAKDLKAEN